MRKLVICMDGTGNEIGDSETNVLKFYRSLSQDDTQLTHYILGVGTYDRHLLAARPFTKLANVLGLGCGLGLEDDVLDAYRWLCRNYRDAAAHERAWRAAHPRAKPRTAFADDQIYVAGFSRGAYAARVLAGFINNFGLVGENDLHLIAPVFRAYRRIGTHDRDEPVNVRFKALRQFEDVLRPAHVPIRALLLFDTVASIIRLGRPWRNLTRHHSLFELGTHANTSSNPSVRIVLHALAVDERRTFFRALHWAEGERFFGNRFRVEAAARTQFLRQRWFAGFHSDIGGAPREDEAGIGKIAALWMLEALAAEEARADAEDDARRAADGQPPLPGGAARAHGLAMRRGNREVYFEGKEYGNYRLTNPGGYRYSGPDPHAPLHDSIFGSGRVPRWSWLWLPLEGLIKSIRRREPGAPAWFRRGLIWYLPLLEPRHIPDSHEVDASVFLRRDDPDCGYDPVNLRGRRAP